LNPLLTQRTYFVLHRESHIAPLVIHTTARLWSGVNVDVCHAMLRLSSADATSTVAHQRGAVRSGTLATKRAIDPKYYAVVGYRGIPGYQIPRNAERRSLLMKVPLKIPGTNASESELVAHFRLAGALLASLPYDDACHACIVCGRQDENTLGQSKQGRKRFCTEPCEAVYEHRQSFYKKGLTNAAN
jgi:hypothetical protein